MRYRHGVHEVFLKFWFDCSFDFFYLPDRRFNLGSGTLGP